MLPARLHVLQHEIHLHRRWLSSFLQRTQSASLSSTTRLATGTPNARKKRDVSDEPYRHATPRWTIGGKKSRPRQKYRLAQDRAAEPEENPIIKDLRRATYESNLQHTIENYNALNQRDKASLEKRDIRQIAQCLHYSVRKEKHAATNQHRRSKAGEMIEFAEVLVRDTKKEAIVPAPKAMVHLLSLFKESGLREKGVQLWKWLYDQDADAYLSPSSYGAAIELLAMDGKPLAQLEELYEEALTRFPGNFGSYHLSSYAILPDREQPFTSGGTSISLLQGILTARLLNGDTRNAYLALDTALRLFPDQVPQRFFSLFLEERPVAEAYTVFAIACRGGNELIGSYYKSMLGTLRRHASLESPAHHALAVRAMLSATYLYIGGGGTVASNSVSEIVITITQFLRVAGIEALPPEDKQKIAAAVMDLIRGVFEIFARYGAKPSIPAFNSIITNLGGFGSSKETIGIALKDVDALDLAPTDVTWRSILAAAGMFHDRGLIERTWAHLRDSRIEAGENPQPGDFHALVKPSHLSGAVAFAQEELDKFRDILPVHTFEGLASRLDDPREAEDHNVGNEDLAEVEGVLAEIEKVKADVVIIKERTQGSPRVQDFSEQILPTILQPISSDLDLPETQLRKIYDDLTLDPAAKSSPPSTLPNESSDAPPARITNDKTKTDIPLGTLRFENWRMLNFLLEQSEKHDRAYSKKVDEAITAGKLPPKRNSGLVGDAEVVKSWGLSDVAKADGVEQEVGEVREEEVERVRGEIVRLRGGV